MPCSCGPCPCMSRGTCRCSGAWPSERGACRSLRRQGIRGRLAEELSAIAGVDYHGAGTHPVRERGESMNMRVALVTGSLFDVLGVTPGVTPLLGRNIRAEDDSVAAAPVVAISYDLWQRRYGANPAVLGRVLTIRGPAATIVALMPRCFGFPAGRRCGRRRSRSVRSPRPAHPTSMCTWSAVSRPARRSSSPRPRSRTTSRATSPEPGSDAAPTNRTSYDGSPSKSDGCG